MRVGRRLVTMGLVVKLVGVAGVALLAACGGGSNSSSGSASMRLLNATSGYPSLDLTLDTTKANTAIAFGAAGTYGSAATSGVATVISNTGSSAALSTVTRTLSKDAHYTLIAYGSTGALKTQVIQEDVTAPASGLTSLQVLNLAPDAGPVDVYLTGSTDTLDGATPIATALSSGSGLPYTSITSGSYRLRVTGTGNKTDLRLDTTTAAVTLGSAKVANLILANGAGGVLVNAVLASQQSDAVALVNTQARVRVISAVPGGATVTATVAGTPLVSGVVAPDIGSYSRVTASTAAPVVVAVNGTQVAVANQAIGPGADYTLMVTGNAAPYTVTLVADDNRYPTVSTGGAVRLVNATSGAATNFTLKVDFSAVAQSIAPGSASAYSNVPASTTARLDVSTGSNVALAPLTSVTITAKGLYSMYLLGDAAAPVVDFRKER